MYLCKHVGMPSSLFHGETLIVELGWTVMLVGSPSYKIFYIQHYQDEGSGNNTTLIEHHVTHIPIPCQKKHYGHLAQYTSACYICSVLCLTSCGTG